MSLGFYYKWRKFTAVPIFGTIPKKLYYVLRAFLIIKHKIDSHYFTLLTENEKRREIVAWAQFSGYDVFVETGTNLGLTTEVASRHFQKCITIELDEGLYKDACKKFKDTPNVKVYRGDSADVLPKLLEDIDQPTVFWLDAHFPKKTGEKAKAVSPIKYELEAIFDHPVKDHVILIDDARKFIGLLGFPTIRELNSFVIKNGGGYQMRINNDIIRIYKDTI